MGMLSEEDGSETPDDDDTHKISMKNDSSSSSSPSSKSFPQMNPGMVLPELKIHIVGNKWISGAQLTPSFAIFALELQKNPKHQDNEEYPVFIDIILKSSDGWVGINGVWKQLLEVARQDKQQKQKQLSYEICGYPERMIAQHAGDTSPTCLHAESIHILSKTPADDLGDAGENIVSTKTILKVEINSKKDTLAATTAPKEENKDTIHPPTTGISTINNSNKSNTKNNRGAKDESRFPKFVEFILNEFGGYQKLCHSPVLDVAGGAGSLAFELVVRYNIPCIVVDTKNIKWTSKQLRHIQFRQNCLDALQEQGGDILMTSSPLARNLYNRFQYQNLDQILQYKTLLDSSIILDGSHDNDCSEENTNTISSRSNSKYSDTMTEQYKLRNLLLDRKVSVMLGLHPDQALDHIIDIGLELNIPWAVVPCCVFPNLFTNRTVRGRKSVRTYEDLCDSILEKDPSIQQDTLPFRGRNKVFFWHPPKELEGKVTL